MENELSQRLARVRKENGFSQEVLAEKMGISRQAVSKWERGESAPDTMNLISLAKIYGITLDELLGDSSVTRSDVYENDDIKIEDAANLPHSAEEIGTSSEKKKRKKEKKEKPPVLYPGINKAMKMIPVVIIVPIVYILIGVFAKIWHPTWLMFFIIPIYYELVLAFGSRTRRAFFRRLPVFTFTVFLFLCFGFFAGAWSTAWVVFLIDPIYYWIAFRIK